MSKQITYVIDDVVVERSSDGNVLTIRPAKESENSATVVGAFSYKVGNCRIRVSPDRGFAKIKDGQHGT